MARSQAKQPNWLESPSSDPLNEEQSRNLLLRADVIRDPLHGDIHLTALERRLIDSPQFQRLRGINQLGMTYVAYPGAVHTRFLHSVGTLHVCTKMIETCNSNANIYQRLTPEGHPVPLTITPYTELLARLCALLHDLAHVPFGHTLVKEGRVFQLDEWQDTARCKILFDKDDPGGLHARVKGFFSDFGIADSTKADDLLHEVWAVLQAEGRKLDALRYPFVHDLVGNTICADLIDYVRRDMYFCGLDERFGDRFLQYLAVIPVSIETEPEEGKQIAYSVSNIDGETTVFPIAKDSNGQRFCKVVLLRYRYNERRVFVTKHDVASEAIDLVRRRLDLAEKIYFHRTKLAASAMLVSAVYDAKLTAVDIWDDTDAEVLKRLEKTGTGRSATLSKKLQARRIFKPIYCVSYRDRNESNTSDALWGNDGVYARFEDPKKCDDLVRKLEHLVGLEIGNIGHAVGSICISCPNRNMNLKAFDMLVLREPGKPVHRLHDSRYEPTRMEIDAILAMHEHLWRFQVLVDPDIIALKRSNGIAMRLAGIIRHEVGPENEIDDFKDADTLSMHEREGQLRLKQVLEDHAVADKIAHTDYEKILEIVGDFGFDSQGEEAHWASVRDKVEHFLRDNHYIS
ncbi:MAG: HD domain-containing protein [Vulcanimicrobiaceae bacterium]